MARRPACIHRQPLCACDQPTAPAAMALQQHSMRGVHECSGTMRACNTTRQFCSVTLSHGTLLYEGCFTSAQRGKGQAGPHNHLGGRYSILMNMWITCSGIPAGRRQCRPLWPVHARHASPRCLADKCGKCDGLKRAEGMHGQLGEGGEAQSACGAMHERGVCITTYSMSRSSAGKSIML